MEIKQISSEIIHKNPWWHYMHDKYTMSDGKEGNYYYCKTNGASMVIPLLDNGKLVLVRQYRYLNEKNGIEFPCGGILNDEETPLEAAKRELLEETGYMADDLVKTGEFEPANGFCQINTRVFVASDLKKIGEPQQNADEVIEVMYRRVDEFDAMIKRGEIWDGQSLASWILSKDYIYSLLR